MVRLRDVRRNTLRQTRGQPPRVRPACVWYARGSAL